MNPIERPPAIVRLTMRLEDATALDPAVQAVEPTIRSVFGTGARAAVLRGDWLGHAVHPLLTDLVLGTWTSASLLDLCGGTESSAAAQRLIGAGLLAVGPTAWPDGRSGRERGRAASGSVLCTLSLTLSPSPCTARRGLPASVVDAPPGSGSRWRAQPSQESAAIWAPTSHWHASWVAATPPMARLRSRCDAPRPLMLDLVRKRMA